MAEHTPGKLCVYEFPAGNGGKVRSLKTEGCQLVIARLVGDGRDAAVNEANARRLAAAWNACEGIPTESLEQGVVADLLECVEAMLEEYEEGRNIQPFEIREMCRDAIARARGEQ